VSPSPAWACSVAVPSGPGVWSSSRISGHHVEGNFDDFATVWFAGENALIDATPTTIDLSAAVAVGASVPELVSLALLRAGLAAASQRCAGQVA
jgi:hypothetical protein